MTPRASMAGLALALGLACCAESAEFQPGVKLEADGKAIDVEIGHLVPSLVDWNGDGRRDLLVGQFMGGKIRLYPNQGTDAQPAFKDFSCLQAGGREISLPAG